MTENVIIVCSIHGEILTTPANHMKSSGCSKCGYQPVWDSRRSNTAEFVGKAKLKHGEMYIYDKVEFVNKKKKVCITCKEHGDFWQAPFAHKLGAGCPKCRYKTTKFNWCNYQAKGHDAILYLVQFFKDEEVFLKVGITLHSVEERYYRSKYSMYKRDSIFEEVTSDRRLIWEMEDFIKNKFLDFRYTPSVPFPGSSTECFSISKKDEILKSIHSLIYSMYELSTNYLETAEAPHFLKRI